MYLRHCLEITSPDELLTADVWCSSGDLRMVRSIEIRELRHALIRNADEGGPRSVLDAERATLRRPQDPCDVVRSKIGFGSYILVTQSCAPSRRLPLLVISGGELASWSAFQGPHVLHSVLALIGEA